MEALNQLSAHAKARLLHELFPGEMGDLITHISEFCAHFSANASHYQKQWSHGFMSFGYWLSLSKETAGILRQYEKQLQTDAKLFSEKLFFSYTSLFVIDRIIKYAQQASTNEKFKLAVELFFC